MGQPPNTNPGGVVFHYGNGKFDSGQEFIIDFATVSGKTYLFTDGINGNNNIVITGDQIPPSNQWSHVAFTVNRNAWKYYLNSTLKKSGTFGTTLNTQSSSTINIGARTDRANTGVPGKIDELKVYNYERSPEQIVQDYSQ